MGQRVCGKRVIWWEGEYEGECELAEGHVGPHWDGLSFFGDWGEPVEEPVLVCRLCGCPVGAADRYGGEVGTRMREQSLCFTDAFWQELVERDRERPLDVVIVAGRHYLVGPGASGGRADRKAGLGFGGSRFDIKFHDGRSLVSNDLWTQGEIPERWRPALPDNAVFLDV